MDVLGNVHSSCEGHQLASPIFQKFTVHVATFYVWAVSAGKIFPVVSSCTHLQEHAETGHSV